MVRLLKPVGLCWLLLLLSACATTSLRSSVEPARQALQHWQLQGKVATQGLGAAVLGWQQSPTKSEIVITAPLGVRAANIKYSSAGLLIESDGRQVPTAEVAAWRRQLGFTAPFMALSAWIQGQPDHKAPYQRLSADRFEQYGWVVTVKKWQTVACQRLPSRLQINGPDNVIKFGGLRWTLPRPVQAPSLFSNHAAMECES